MFDKKFIMKLQEVDVYMSTKNRLPNKENCEIHCKGVDKLFTFGVQKQIEDCPQGKLYICFQFGNLDEDKIINQ